MSFLALIIQPDTDDPDFAEVLVDGVVAGHPYRFLLDTGAARTTLPHDPLTAALPVVGTQGGSGVFGAFQDELVTVPEIVLGPLRLSSPTVVRGGPASAIPRPLIGMDVLKGHRLQFQFHKSRIQIDQAVPYDVLVDQALWLDAGAHPYVSVQLGSVQAQAVWDTGAGVTVVDLRFSELHPELFAPAGTSVGTDATGTSMQTPMLRMAPAVIGGVSFAPQRVAAVDLSSANATLDVPMDLILGFNVLSQGEWVFDFPRRRWGVKPLDRAINPPQH